jgi:glycosyltransferase involved in cell wall biosynthesis
VKKHVVVFIDFRGILTSEKNEDTVKRHVRYSNSLREMTSNSSRVIVASFRDITKQNTRYEEIEFVQVSKTGFPNLYAFRNLKRIFAEYKSSSITIVAGDPWETYWVSLICKVMFSRTAKLQVQIHADVASELWRKQSLSNKVRCHLLFVDNRFIDSIRFVSKGQYEKFRIKYETGNAGIVIVPVPLNITGVIDDVPEKKRSDILFVGRLHKDRGLDTFCKIIKKLNSVSSEFVVNVVGDGPEKEHFLKTLKNICGEERVKSFGFSNNVKIQQIVKSCRLLLSTAPSESYGRAMREAIFYGVPVWSVANEGALELQKDFGAQIVRILNPRETADLLFREYVEFGRVSVSRSVREQINLSDTARIRTLAESWL